MKTKPLNTALIAAGVLAVGTAGAFTLRPDLLDKAKAGLQPVQAAVATQGSGDLQVAALTPTAAPAPVPMIAGNGQVPNYRAIVQQFGPAVVGITVAGTQKAEGPAQGGGRGLPPSMEDDPFFQFFKGIPGYGQGGPRGGQGGQPQQPFRGQGSGFIISDDGLILTNAHVVRDAKDVTVKLSDRREYPAKVLGSDPVTDVAVLRIDAKGLPMVRLGDPRQLGVGDPVLAIGAPFGFEQTATQGIVSAKGRSLPGDAVVPFIQTDAAVNPGNSGGALVSLNGDLIGINTAIATETGSFAGYSFAIPSNLVRKVVSDLIEFGVVQRGFIGITIKDVDPRTARRKKLRNSQGVYVASLTKGGAAAEAGLRAGDIIQAINGRHVSSTSELQEQLANYRPGQQVKLDVWRDGEQFERALVLRNVEGGTELIRLRSGSSSIAKKAIRLGATFSDVSGDDLRKLNLEYAVKVVSIADGSQLARVGIRQGYVITRVDKQSFSSYTEFIDLIEAASGTLYLEAVHPSGKTAQYTVNLEESPQ